MSTVCIALAGLPGAGKTTLANEWCRITGAHLLSRDAIKRAAFGSTLDVGTEQNEVAFTALKAALPIILRSGRSVIIDGCTFAKMGLMEDVEAICASSHARCIPVLVHCPAELAAQRLSLPDPSTWPC